MPATLEGARAWRKVNVTRHRSKACESLPEMKRDIAAMRERMRETKLPDTLQEAERTVALLDQATETAGERRDN